MSSEKYVHVRRDGKFFAILLGREGGGGVDCLVTEEELAGIVKAGQNVLRGELECTVLESRTSSESVAERLTRLYPRARIETVQIPFGGYLAKRNDSEPIQFVCHPELRLVEGRFVPLRLDIESDEIERWTVLNFIIGHILIVRDRPAAHFARTVPAAERYFECVEGEPFYSQTPMQLLLSVSGSGESRIRAWLWCVHAY